MYLTQTCQLSPLFGYGASAIQPSWQIHKSWHFNLREMIISSLSVYTTNPLHIQIRGSFQGKTFIIKQNMYQEIIMIQSSKYFDIFYLTLIFESRTME